MCCELDAVTPVKQTLLTIKCNANIKIKRFTQWYKKTQRWSEKRTTQNVMKNVNFTPRKNWLVTANNIINFFCVSYRKKTKKSRTQNAQFNDSRALKFDNKDNLGNAGGWKYLSNGFGITFFSSISLLAALFFSAVSVLLVWARDTGNVAILSPLSTSTVDIFESGPPIFEITHAQKTAAFFALALFLSNCFVPVHLVLFITLIQSIGNCLYRFYFKLFFILD